MKTTITILLALLLMNGGMAQASPDQYTVKIDKGDFHATSTVNEWDGAPISITNKLPPVFDCKITFADGSTQTIKREDGDSVYISIMPFARTGENIQATISLSISSVTMEREAVVIGKDCRILPSVGQSVSLTAVENFVSGQPKTIALSDGSNVTVTVTRNK